MKINCKQTFVTLQGKVLNHGGCPSCGTILKKGVEEPLTLGYILADTVLGKHENKNGFRPLKGWELAQKFYKNKEVEIDESDFIQIKELLPKAPYINLVIGQAEKMLSEVK